MLHSSISWLLLAAPVACCVWAAAGAGGRRKQDGGSEPGGAIPAPLPDDESAASRLRTQIGNLNQRLADLDERLVVLAETNRHLVDMLRSCTAQLCLSQTEIGLDKEELALTRARMNQLEAERNRSAALPPSEIQVVDELAEARIAAVLHGHAGRRRHALPPAYLAGLEQDGLAAALGCLLGGTEPLSRDSMRRLGEHWQRQHAAWNSEPIEGEVLYLWADAAFVRAGLEPEGAALLVIVAGMADGTRSVVSVEAGARESAQAWSASLECLVRRGMNVPRLVIGEDGLGLWPALERAGWASAQQRCWSRRIEHVVEALPKRQRRRAGQLLRALAKAETRAEANARKASWVKRYGALYPEALARLESDWARMLGRYGFPAAHWPQLRSTAVIGSLLSSLRLQTKNPEPLPVGANAEALLWKLLLVGSRGLSRLKQPRARA